jgi:hypothetical protein
MSHGKSPCRHLVVRLDAAPTSGNRAVFERTLLGKPAGADGDGKKVRESGAMV